MILTSSRWPQQIRGMAMKTPNTRALIGVIKTGQAYLRWDDTT